MNKEFDIFPARGSFEPEEAILLHVVNDCGADSLRFRICSIDDVDVTKRIPIEDGRSCITVCEAGFPVGGYRVEAQFLRGEEVLAVCFTAFDVMPAGKILRYGFLSDFGSGSETEEDVRAMARMHINAVQFYDWSYRHDDLVSPTPDYTDMMGKHNNLTVIREKIRQCHAYGMKALAYGAVYAASRRYQQQHPEQSLYNGRGEPLCFIDTFFIMNPSKDGAWQEHIIEQYQKAMDAVGFDGIHMDTYGAPKTALDYHGNTVYLEDEFPRLIERTHCLSLQSHERPFLIFNNVGGWPAAATMHTGQQAVYIEVWPPYTEYRHLGLLITEAKKSGKPVILAAYPAAFRTDTPERALESQLLLSFVIGMYGATQLFFGEENAVITQGYYADYTKLNDAQLEQIRSYQDFLVQYETLFMDESMEDVSMSHQGWDNHEYLFSPAGSADGESGKIWYHLLQSRRRKVVCVVNLTNNTSAWNEGKNAPDGEVPISLQIQVTKKPDSVWMASADRCHGKQQPLPYRFLQTDQSAAVQMEAQIYRCGIVVIEGG